MPWRWYTWWMRTDAVSMAEGNVGRRTKWTDLANQTMMVKVTVVLSEGGWPVTKSRAMRDQGRCRTGRDRSRPTGSSSILPSWISLSGAEAREVAVGASLVGEADTKQGWKMEQWQACRRNLSYLASLYVSDVICCLDGWLGKITSPEMRSHRD